jgi:hypothetical protein
MIGKIIVATLIASTAGTASAATVVYDALIDLDPAQHIDSQGKLRVSLPGTLFQLNVGDAFQGSITFANGGRVTVFDSVETPVGSEWVLALFRATNGTVGQFSGALQFLGVQGDYTGPASIPTGGSGGAFAFSAFGNYTNSSFSFSGLSYSGIYNSGDATLFDPLDLTTPRGTVSISEAGAVPEPTTWAMMLIGFGAVGASMRRARQNVRLAYSG